MSQRRGKTPVATFQSGDRVRVRQGVVDDDYPDMPIGGWAGTVAEIHDDGMCTVLWSDETLAAIHPVFKKRCERDGLEFESYSIGADELEADAGGPLEIEQPTKITARPLSPKDQDDRIRTVFGLTSDDLLPDVDDETLASYREYLSKKVVFPFPAEHGEGFGHPERVKVVGFGVPDDELTIVETYGILCEARMEDQIVTLPLGELDDVRGKPNRQLVEDYCYWFWNWR